MSVESAHHLITKLGTDAAFRERVQHVAPAERTALLESYGFGDVSRADVESAKAGGELSDNDLQAVAGGAWLDDVIFLINYLFN